MINVQTDELLNKFLNVKLDLLSQQDKAALSECREEIILNLYAIFSEEIPYLLKERTCLNPTLLLQGLKLASFLKARETFGLIRKICLLPFESLEECLEYDLTDELAGLLANTMVHWSHLKHEIEDPSLDENVRTACLEALVYAVLQGDVARDEIVAYFKSLFQKILNGELEEELFSEHLVISCCHLWPAECLEEIRELFGFELVDENYIQIEDVLEDFAKGQENCLKEAKLEFGLDFACKEFQDGKDLSQNLNGFINKFNTAESEAKHFFKPCGRNETCPCGSGQKYKKCCLNKPSLIIEEAAITYKALEDSDALKALSEEERNSILDLYQLTEDDPEEVLEKAPKFIAKHPDIPMLHNYLCVAYRRLNRTKEAMMIVKNMQKRFPNYFFGRSEYALYLLRRGEPEKAEEALGKAQMLSQLYPDRTVFHVSEWKAFLITKTLCYLQKDDLKQAKNYLKLLNKIDPGSYEAEDLKKKIEGRFFSQTMNI